LQNFKTGCGKTSIISYIAGKGNTVLGEACRVKLKKLHSYMMRHLKKIMGITWRDKITNVEIR